MPEDGNSYELWREAETKRIEGLKQQLKDCNLDGPFYIRAGDLFSSIALAYAICDLCGAMVRLEDPIEVNDVRVERSVLRHTAFHGDISKEESDGSQDA